MLQNTLTPSDSKTNSPRQSSGDCRGEESEVQQPTEDYSSNEPLLLLIFLKSSITPVKISKLLISTSPLV